MRSICFFSSYFTDEAIPLYVRVYLEELRRHFTEVIFLTNEKKIITGDLHFLETNKIEYRLYKNEGHDFGMWYKAFEGFPVSDYNRIGLVNDSCILFKRLDFIFDWIDKGNPDYCGITDSNKEAYHIQSYFLVIGKRAIPLVQEYFKKNKLKENIKDVIHAYEIGLSSWLISKGMKTDAYFSKKEYYGEHNPMLLFSDDLIKNGIPLIKKKIVFGTFRREEYFSLMRMNFNVDPHYYCNLIKKNNGDLLIDFDEMLNKNSKTLKSLIRKYNFNLFFFRIFRKFKSLVK